MFGSAHFNLKLYHSTFRRFFHGINPSIFDIIYGINQTLVATAFYPLTRGGNNRMTTKPVIAYEKAYCVTEEKGHGESIGVAIPYWNVGPNCPRSDFFLVPFGEKATTNE
jgi:hypothetical protein